MPVCSAFTKQSTPCTSRIYTHERTLCGRHLHMISTPELEARFNREQEILRANWRGLQEGTHVRVGTRIVPVGQPIPAGVRQRPPPPPISPLLSQLLPGPSEGGRQPSHQCLGLSVTLLPCFTAQCAVAGAPS